MTSVVRGLLFAFWFARGRWVWAGVALGLGAWIKIPGLLAAPAIWGGGEMNPFHRLVAWGAAAAISGT